MNISDAIAALLGGADPNQAVLTGAGAAGPPGPPPQPVEPQPNGPQGVQTPVTNPRPANQTPTTTQSPPDLANMYLELMKKNQNAAQLDSGLNLIAAGLSNSPQNRVGLIQGAMAGGGKGMSLSASDLINFQKQDQEMRNAMIRKAALPALMKQYNMTPAQIQALEASGKLDEVLQNFATRSLGQVKDENGQTHLVDDRAESAGGGKGGSRIIATLGSEKEDPTQVTSGPLGNVVINMRTGQPVGAPLGLPPDKTIQVQPNGTYIVVDKTATPSGTVVGAAAKPGDVIDPIQNRLHAINTERAAKNEAPMTLPELIALEQQGKGVHVAVYTGADGVQHPAPKQGYDYKRIKDGPNAGKLEYGADGLPIQVPISTDEKSKVEATAQELTDKAKKERVAKAQTAFAAGNVGNAVRTAFAVADKPGATGFLSKPARALGLGGAPSDDVDQALSTINANTAFTQLRSMREASASGASGLGQLTEKEGQMLSSVIADLRPYQSTGRFKEGLARVEAAMVLLASDSFEKGTDQAGFDKALGEMTQEILAREHNKASGAGGSKVRVVPR